MRARRIWVSAIALLALLTPAATALAQPGLSKDAPRPGEAGRGRGGPGMHARAQRAEGAMEWLGLTEAQQKQMKEIRERGEATRTGLQKQLLRLRNDMRGEMLKDQPDRRKIVQIAEQIGGVQTKLGVHRAEQMLSMREVLTPEQRDRWMTRGHGPMGMRGMHRGPGGRGGHGGPGGRGGPGGPEGRGGEPGDL